MPNSHEGQHNEVADEKHEPPEHKPNIAKRAQSPKVGKSKSPGPTIKQASSPKRCQSASPSMETAGQKNKSHVSPKHSAPLKINVTVKPKKAKPIYEQNASAVNEGQREGALPPQPPPKDVVLPQPVAVKLSRQLATKKRDFIKFKKLYSAQQNALLTQFSELKQLMSRVGATCDDVGDVAVVTVTEWPVHDLLMLTLHDSALDIHRPFESSVLHHIQSELDPIPQEFRKLGDEMMSRRQELLNMVRSSKLRLDRATYVANIELKAKNVEFDVETENLQQLINNTIEDLKSRINSTLVLAKASWLDREALAQKIERLQKDNLVLQHKQENAKYEVKKTNSNSLSHHVSYQTINEELKKERASRGALKNMVNTADNMARAARSRISELEKQLKDTRVDLDTVRRKNKELENLYKHREATYESRSKRLLEVSRTGETTIDGLSRQRDALELRVKELQEELVSMTQVNETHFEEQRILQQILLEKEKETEFASNRIRELEESVQDLENRYAKIKDCSAKLVDYERNRCLEFIPTKESEPCDRETELWKELQETRIRLTKTQEELKISREDKENFLGSLDKIAKGQNADNKIDKMAAELVEREKTILNLQRAIKALEENEEALQQNINQYQQQLFELQFENRKLKNYDCYVKDPEYPELQAELMQLQMKVAALNRERSELISAASSRALMLERHERSADLFSKVTLTRRELGNLLEGKDPDIMEYRGRPVSESLSAMCADAAETWSAVRTERAKVQHLERALDVASRQLGREGNVRTRLQQRRAKLERELMRTNIEGRFPLDVQENHSRHTDISAANNELRQHLAVFGCRQESNQNFE